jgi:hypothetical protein
MAIAGVKHPSVLSLLHHSDKGEKEGEAKRGKEPEESVRERRKPLGKK